MVWKSFPRYGKPRAARLVGEVTGKREAAGQSRGEFFPAVGAWGDFPRGGSSFFGYSLPEAILKFRQGVGRLIRSATDRGIVWCWTRG